MKKASDYYPITTIKYPDGTEISVITDAHINQYTRPVDLESFGHQMEGQTRILEGYYVYDVERWLNKRPVVD